MAKLVPQHHHALHTIAEEVSVEEIASTRIQKILKDMRSALASYKATEYVGLAIAAPQIGVPLRIFLVEDLQDKKKNDTEAQTPRLPSLVAINPRIIRLSKKKQLMHEGCLSVKDIYGGVIRPTHATIRAYDERGIPYERGASGLLAQIFQHEIDHLDGILFVDRAEEILHPDEAAVHHRAQTAL